MKHNSWYTRRPKQTTSDRFPPRCIHSCQYVIRAAAIVMETSFNQNETTKKSSWKSYCVLSLRVRTFVSLLRYSQTPEGVDETKTTKRAVGNYRSRTRAITCEPLSSDFVIATHPKRLTQLDGRGEQLEITDHERELSYVNLCHQTLL